MDLTFNSGFAKESQSTREDDKTQTIVRKYQYPKKPTVCEWMKWNGAYVYAYGCSLAGTICSLFSPLSDMYQGNNLFPYVSEVIRSGIPKAVFIIGCSVGLIPTMYFAWNYLVTSMDYNKLNFNTFQRWLFNVLNVIVYICFVYSAFSVIGVSFCDMDSFPELHTLFSFSWVIITNIMGILQYCIVFSNLYIDKRTDRKFILSKLGYLLFSMVGMGNFAILGSYVPCHSYHVSMESCLMEYSEEFCFRSQLTTPETTQYIMYRYYGHCPVLHYIRGVGEFLAVVSTMFYLTTMVYDVKLMRSIILDRIDVTNSVGILDRRY